MVAVKRVVVIRLAVAGAIAVAAGVVGIPWVYIHLIKDDPPPKLSFEQRDRLLSTTTISP
jgi:hypothetical protein